MVLAVMELMEVMTEKAVLGAGAAPAQVQPEGYLLSLLLPALHRD